jgi:hypothetical protein
VGVSPPFVRAVFNDDHSLTQHLVPTEVLLYCPPAHAIPTSVAAGATIQATPPDLQYNLPPQAEAPNDAVAKST